MVVLTLFILIAMLVVAGMGVDFMRYETERARLQSAADRAVLAAAGISNPMDAQLVVESYFRAAGLEDHLESVSAEVDETSREVSAVASMNVNMAFLPMIGINSMETEARATAFEGRRDVEIALVLDVSGSMGRNRKIENMRNAADAFVEYLFDEFGDEQLAITLVPYTTQVNLPPQLFSLFTGVLPIQTTSQCMDFAPEAYGEVAITPGFDQMWQGGHFDARTIGWDWWNCVPDPATQVQPLTNNESHIRTRIGQLTANDLTSIEIGVKWGAAMLDPAMRPLLAGLVGQLGISSLIGSAHPYDYDRPNTDKYLVVLTDGVNTSHYELNEHVTGGMSDIFRLGSTYYVGFTEPGDMDGDGTPNEAAYLPGEDRWEPLPLGIQLSWADVFADVPVREYAEDFRRHQTVGNEVNDDVVCDTFGGQGHGLGLCVAPITQNLPPWTGNGNGYVRVPGGTGYNAWYADTVTYIGEDLKNERTDEICSAAKSTGSLIFTIGFEAPVEGADVLRDCASSPSHYYVADGSDIEDVFLEIANQISTLRLTQ